MALEEITVRRARTRDVRGIRQLIDAYSGERRLLSKAAVALYEDVAEFLGLERVKPNTLGNVRMLRRL